ncbi:hypothetical protein O181_111612 [Austropuccinia psidii MF-1]|uniref:Uncharacterized protein n=1 Tax=Austropuccinia psidii MF-1 TaxID=1389203 RepID=A0A9Q3PTJ3_9BASI|nr:hypothetical protein [Austropuccinia psidii MF-1]
MGVVAILTWNQVGANWSPLVLYGHLVMTPLLGHILPSLASLANFHPLSLVGFGPFRPPTASTARGPGQPYSPQGQVGPKPQLGPPEPILATNPLDPNLAKNPLHTKMAIEPVGPILAHVPPRTIIPAMASGNQLSQPFPQLKGNSSLSAMHPVLKVARVVHIWYYIPLCTIFAQQSNGDAFGTKSQNQRPF